MLVRKFVAFLDTPTFSADVIYGSPISQHHSRHVRPSVRPPVRLSHSVGLMAAGECYINLVGLAAIFNFLSPTPSSSSWSERVRDGIRDILPASLSPSLRRGLGEKIRRQKVCVGRTDGARRGIRNESVLARANRALARRSGGGGTIWRHARALSPEVRTGPVSVFDKFAASLPILSFLPLPAPFSRRRGVQLQVAARR